MKSIHYSALLLSSALLVGCASQGTAYYTLSTPQSNSVSSANDRPFIEPYIVHRVTVPAAVDDTPLIVRKSNDQLMVLSNDKWTAPLGEILRNALSQAMTQTLGTPPRQGVMPNSGVQVSSANEIIVDIQQFDMQPARQASLAAVWRVNFTDKKQPSMTCYSFLSEPAAAGVAPLVAAQQKNVLSLAQQMAFTLQNRQAPNGAKCQTES